MKISTAAAAALLLAGGIALAGCAPTGSGGSMPGMDHSASDAPASESSASDANAADAMFATMMIVHHEQAVEMSDLVLGDEGVDPRVIDLAERIKAAQSPEIEQLRGWLDDWGVSAESGGQMDHGDGMMTADDLAALEDATGVEASRLFLEQMIVHHEGAIDMAESQLADGQNPDAVALAQSIVDAQGAEIAEMKELLSTL
ncbi:MULTISPECIES: DUF305 domain-containing protein [Microbacterium]|uniref:DUF305 domain-containing protein n=1 Tax=Microbacterium TaxID=33882 RepID=UPI000CFDDF16|nr:MULTISPECIES: DUF305 domain-containing protein [unclassified Microbacterium]PRB08173.1 DUF305 domain-containing protein [Microbacterium sp. MYb72]